MTFLGFDDWFFYKYETDRIKITKFTIARWHGHELMQWTFKNDEWRKLFSPQGSAEK